MNFRSMNRKTQLCMDFTPIQLNWLFKGNHERKMDLMKKCHSFVILLIVFTVFSHFLCGVTADSFFNSSTVDVTYSVPIVYENTTQKPPATLKPSSILRFILELDNSGPAVLDSKIIFEATLTPLTNESTKDWPFRYIFQWMNMANMEITTTQDHLVSHISIIFSSDHVKAGEYPMTVAAFHTYDPSKMVSFQTRKFTLTDQLNGQLSVEQVLNYQRFPSKVFSTNVMTFLTTFVADHFQSSKDPSFKYKWYKNGTCLKETQEPTLTAIFGTPTNITMRSEVIAKFEDQDYDVNNSLQELSHIPGVRSLSSPVVPNHPAQLIRFQRSSQEIAQLGMNRRQMVQAGRKMKKHYNKDGSFTASLCFKDPLISCTVYRVEDEKSSKKKSIATGSALLINVTCSGSIPSSICWKTSAVNTTGVDPCDPLAFVPTTLHQIELKLNDSGWVELHFFVYNDVSRVHVSHNFYAYHPGSGENKALYLPLIFGVIGVIIIVIGTIYMMRLRKKPLVEVADFDFHPSLTSSIEASNGSLRVSKLMRTLKYLLFVRGNKDTRPLGADSSLSSSLSTSIMPEPDRVAKDENNSYGSL